MPFIETTISSEIVYDGPIFKIHKHKVNTVGGGTSVRDVLEHGGGAVMIPMLNDGRIIMEKQFRKAVETEIYELPAGKRDPGETFTEAAIRELREEVGYEPDMVEFLTSIYPSVGYSSERLDIFICTGLKKVERKLDEDEDIELIPLEVDEVIEMIKKHEIKDAKTVSGVLLARTMGLI